MPDTITLYHGTTHDFDVIDVLRGKPFKDFGQGFYLSESFEHAHKLALRNRRIEEMRQKAAGDEIQFSVYVYEYEFNSLEMDKLNVKCFKSADREWLKFIILNRTNQTRQHDYDIVIGPTANDDTRTAIRAVMNAANGAILSDAALDLLLEMLEPNALPEQYFFGKNNAASSLRLTRRHEFK